MFHISGADSSIGIQKSSLWGAVMGGSFVEGVGLELGLSVGRAGSQDLEHK